MPTPLFDAVKEYTLQKNHRFHMPGHSGSAEALLPFSHILPFDITEVDGLDALYLSDGVIKEAEHMAAAFFGTEQTLISAGGCTLAIQTMLGLLGQCKGKILVARNCHRAVVHALGLLDFTAEYVYPDKNDGGRINPADIKTALEADKNIRAVFITSPTYYGVLSNITAIADVCRQAGIPLLVDNAHGTHLIFFNKHPISQGASMTACSAHKTLPVLTGGAWLNIADKRFCENSKNIMSVFGSTSPSYLIMSSLDLCRDWCEREGKKAFSELKEKVSEIREYAETYGFPGIKGETDPVRITLDIEGTENLSDVLEHEKIIPEYYDSKYIVLLPTPFLKKEDFTALQHMIRTLKRTGLKKQAAMIEKPRTVLSPREALFAEKEAMRAEVLLGRTAAEPVCLYPPGIPLVMPGEQISAGIRDTIINSGISFVKVVK